LKLAAGVESNTIHPVGKAIVEAARAASCTSVKVYMHLVEVFHVIILEKHGNK
jgi:Cu2+-exporting ATPase